MEIYQPAYLHCVCIQGVDRKVCISFRISATSGLSGAQLSRKFYVLIPAREFKLSVSTQLRIDSRENRRISPAERTACLASSLQKAPLIARNPDSYSCLDPEPSEKYIFPELKVKEREGLSPLDDESYADDLNTLKDERKIDGANHGVSMAQSLSVQLVLQFCQLPSTLWLCQWDTDPHLEAAIRLERAEPACLSLPQSAFRKADSN